METKLVQLQDPGTMRPIDSLDYRGMHVDFYEDPLGDQLVTMWQNTLVEFGSGNTLYADDMKLLIDDKLDTIIRFQDFPQSRLEWFDNGGHRDIRLLQHRRVLKIYIIENRELVNTGLLIFDAMKFLSELAQKEKDKK